MILVTGANGFLGSHIANFLIQKGKKIRMMHRESSDLSLIKHLCNEENTVIGDILDYESIKEAMKGVTEVYHTAAMVSFDARDVKTMLKINVEGTQNIVNVALEMGIKKVLYVSSIAALGRSESNEFITEGTHWVEDDLNSPYAKSKYLGELEVWRAKEEGLSIVIINPSIILGNGAWKTGTGKFFELAYSQFPFYTNGTNGWVDVKDVANLSIMLMDSDIQGQRFIASEGNHTYKTIFHQIAHSLNKKKAAYSLNPFLGNLLWPFAEIFARLTFTKPFITRYSMKNALNHSFYSNEKILKTFPNFKFTPIENTIENTAKDFLKLKGINSKKQ